MDLGHVNKVLEEALDAFSEQFLDKKYKPTGGQGRLLIKCNSHRARSRATAYVRTYPDQLCSFYRDVGKGVFQVTKEEMAEIKQMKIKGITGYKDGDDLFRCWKTVGIGGRHGS